MIAKFYGRFDDGKFYPDEPQYFSVEKKKLDGKRGWVAIGKEERNRTLPQNRYYWGVVIKTLADEFGYFDQECHEALLHKFSVIPGESGKPDRVKRTSDMTTVEMNEYIEKIRLWADIEFQVYIPLPDEVYLNQEEQ